jgi:hypothetical protein
LKCPIRPACGDLIAEAIWKLPPRDASDRVEVVVARVLFAWESGSGQGHLLQMRPLAAGLVARGHRVSVALRHLTGTAASIFGDVGVRLLQAPFKSAGPRPGGRSLNYADVLANTGWADGRELFVLCYAWRNLIQSERPDVVVFDHAPTALLASRLLPFPVKRIVIGSGFCVPPDEYPLPALPLEPPGDPDVIRRREADVLKRANDVLLHAGKPGLERLGRLYSDVHETFLTTFNELEQYPFFRGGTYWGPVLPAGGEAPQWPSGDGKRVFAYLKRSDGLSGLAATLAASGRPTILYVESSTLRVTAQHQDLRRAAAECDAAVLHAGQGATAAVLLAGKPILQIPLVLEQRLTADATARLGAGIVVPDRGKDPAAAGRMLDELLTNDTYATAARRFALKYADFDPEAQVHRMVERVEELIQSGRGGEEQKGRPGDTGTRGQGAGKAAPRRALFAG